MCLSGHPVHHPVSLSILLPRSFLVYYVNPPSGVMPVCNHFLLERLTLEWMFGSESATGSVPCPQPYHTVPSRFIPQVPSRFIPPYLYAHGCCTVHTNQTSAYYRLELTRCTVHTERLAPISWVRAATPVSKAAPSLLPGLVRSSFGGRRLQEECNSLRSLSKISLFLL